MRGTLALFSACLLLGMAPAGATEAHVWEIKSPNHAQTFTFGSERRRAWINVHGHLAVVLDFTNDPYVDRTNPREYDDFTFDFPGVVLGLDGRTFYYHPRGKNRPVPVAERYRGLFGLEEVRLLPSSFLVVEKPHGMLSLTLLIDPRRVLDR
jgi:hypothetical protein